MFVTVFTANVLINAATNMQSDTGLDTISVFNRLIEYFLPLGEKIRDTEQTLDKSNP